MTHDDAERPALPQAARNQSPGIRQMLGLWVPLAASIVIMVLEPSIVNIALGRTAEQELALAAYGVAYSLALLVEAPILMLLDASVARSTDRVAFFAVRRFTVLIGLAVTVVGLVLSLTPLYELVVVRLMHIPRDVADWAQPTLVALSFWSFPIAWRRTYQGILIRAGRTGIITAATVVRLAVLAAVLFAGLQFWPDNGAALAGVAMDLCVVVEAALITHAARPVLRSLQAGSARVSEEDRPPQSLRPLWRFYRPLMVTSLLRQSVRPILNYGIAAAQMVRASLAAWPVAWGLATLVAGPAWSLQQLSTALSVDRPSYRKVRIFSLALSSLFSLILALIAFTPAYETAMGRVYGLSPELLNAARPATGILVVMPWLFGTQSVVRGALIRRGSTRAVRRATVVNLAVLVVTMALGLWLLPLTGVTLAAVSAAASNLAELGWLLWEGSRL